MILRRSLTIAFLLFFLVASVAAQEGDTPQAFPMLFPAGIDIPYDPDDPWPGPASAAAPSSRAVASADCAHWENDGLQLIRYREELWIFFNPQGGRVFCGIPVPYPYPSSPADVGEFSGSSAPALSTPERPPVFLGNFAIRPLAQLSVAELARAQDDGVIPHQRLSDGGFTLGFPAAPITIVVFSDYACPYCRVYEEEIIAQVVEIFVATGRARLEYRFFPTVDYQTGGELSKLAACVGELEDERFWAGHAFLYQRAARGRLYSYNTGQLLADETAVDYQTLKQCVETVAQVSVDVALGQSVGVRGTPMVSFRYLADGQSLSPARRALPFAELSAIIKQAILR